MSAPGLLARAPGERRRLVVRSLAALALVVLAIVLIGPRGQDGAPLDPRSTGPLGTRGILDVMSELGVTPVVSDGGVSAEDGVVLVITDELTDGQRDGLRDWVTDGGRLVLTDPYSDLAPDIVGLTSVAFTEPTIEPDCDDPFVSGVGRVALAGANVMEPAAGATGCFPRNGGWWMVRTPTGRGEIITLGGAFTLTNELLGQVDTAVLLVNLLTPDRGGNEPGLDRGGLRVLTGDTPAGAASLTELLPDQVTLALVQIPLAWLALVWWRGRRHGRPVSETSPIRVEAAETTIAVGALLQRAGATRDAGAIVRAHVRRELLRRLGLGDVVRDDHTLVAVAASRTDLDPGTLAMLLTGPLPEDDDAVVAFAAAAARTVEGIRQRRSSGAPGHSPSAPPSAQPDHPHVQGARIRE